MHSSKRDMLSARNTSLYAYGTYHTRIVIPYAYGIQNCTIRVWYIPYAYGMYRTYAYGIKYAYGTEQRHYVAIDLSKTKISPIPELTV